MYKFAFKHVNMVVKKAAFLLYLPFKHQLHKLVKHTQTICPQQPKNCLSVFDLFVGLALKVLTPT